MSAWKDLVTASLLGTEKSGAATPLPAALGEVLGSLGKLNPEAQFLTRAGALALWRQAGWKPIRDEAAVHSPSPPENLPLINPTSIAHLRALLDGHCAEVLPEWLGEVARLGKRVPPEWLPALLEWARQNRARRPLAVSACGERVRWLATLNPAWNFAADDSPEHWETGGREQRIAILRGWRASQPAEARAKLEAVWNAESADTRAAFLAVLAEGLSGEDEGLLERTLDDRGKEVRLIATDLLARLPGSSFVARMIARAESLLTFKRGGLLSRASLEITLPPDPDPAACRDGLDPKIFGPVNSLGAKATLLTLIVAAIPLQHWTNIFHQTPAELLKAVKKSDFADALATGWALAAFRQHDAVWAEALLEAPVSPLPALLGHRPLSSLLPEGARASRLVATLRGGFFPPRNNWQAWQSLASQFDSFIGYLPNELARELVNLLYRLKTGDQAAPPEMWQYAKAWFLKMPPAFLPDALAGWSSEKTYAADLIFLIELLAYRHEVLTVMTQS